MNIKAIREKTEMTQTALAEKLGVSQQAVSFWETGERYPRTADLPRLAAVLGVTVDEILREPDAAPERKEAST